MRIHRIRAIAAIIAASTALVACSTSTTGSIAGSNRSQLLLLPADKFNNSAAQAYMQLNSQARTQGNLITSGAEYNRVNAITRRLVSQVGYFRPDARNWAWQISLIDSNQRNAFAMPGGKMAIYTGLIRQLHLSDAEIAAILGHEIAHALREHSREKMSQQQLSSIALQIGGAAAGLGQGGMQLAGLAKQLGMDLPFSRAMESEADVYGLELAARAGYDPRAALTLWDKMAAASGNNNQPSFLSTHPSDSNRKQRLTELMPRVLPLYEAAIAGTRTASNKR